MVRRSAWVAVSALVACVSPAPDSPPQPTAPPPANAAPATPSPAGEKSPPRQPAFHGPALTDEARESRRQAQTRLLGKVVFGEDYPEGIGPASAPPPTGEDLAPVDALTLGRFISLQGGGDGAMAAFHGALRTLTAVDSAAPKVRVAFYGSSQTAADFMTQYLRGYLQHRFGDGGHGFVALAAPWKGYRHLDVFLETKGQWHTDHSQREDRREDGRYGLLGAAVSSSSQHDRSTVKIRKAALGTRHELMFLSQPTGGHFEVDVDGTQRASIDTKAGAPANGLHELNVRDAREIRIRPRGDGEVRLFGMILENDLPGVVVDTLGINGARAANHLLWDETLWAEALARRAPALYILAYGANESGSGPEEVTLDVYERELGEVLDRFARAAPDASCLMLGPGDYPELDEETGAYHVRDRLQKIIEIQRAMALERGCAFWDTQAFMGGPMGMATWVRAEPTMARPDHLHLTRRGYARMGMALTDAIMYGYDAPDE